MCCQGPAWTAFHLDGDTDDEAAFPICSQLAKGLKLWWIVKRWREVTWFCRRGWTPVEWANEIKTRKLPNVRWWLQKPGETIYLPFDTAHQVFSIHKDWTVPLTWMLIPVDPDEESNNKKNIINRLPGSKRSLCSGVKRRNKSCLGRYSRSKKQVKLICFSLFLIT